MSLAERAGLALLSRLDPERAHALALTALAARHALGLSPGPAPPRPRLAGKVWGLDVAHPVGIAAGFDKNAEAVAGALAAGAAFVEIGAVTPRSQPGNPRPRLFRLPEDRGVINRFGFNNHGMEAIAARLAAARAKGLPPGPVAVNLGANKDSADRAGDYAAVLTRFAGLAEIFTVNVSSPNTERLRDLQGRAALEALLGRVLAARDAAAPGAPVLVKLAPDLDETALAEAVDACLAEGADGIVATNTTLARDGLRSSHATEAGGLSGAPLRDRAQTVLAAVARRTAGRVPLVGVGGLSTPGDVYARIRAGARLVQVYTALVYEGPSLLTRLAEGLDDLLARDGFAHVEDAVGADL